VLLFFLLFYFTLTISFETSMASRAFSEQHRERCLLLDFSAPTQSVSFCCRPF
jgi:hypothetical protein